MSDEPQPLRLKPRPPPGGEVPPPPEAPASVPAPAEPPDGTGRLRLKPRLIVTDEAAEVAAQSAREPDFPAAAPVSEVPPPMSASPLAEDLPVFKLRPKAKPGALAPPPLFEPPAPGLAEPPSYPEATSTPMSAEALPPEPPSGRSPMTMPPVSVLSAAPPPEPAGTAPAGEAPEPGAAPEPPAVPGSAPRLSMGGPAPGGASAPPAVKPGLNLKVSSPPPVKGGRPPVVKPGKPPKVGSVLRKRSALGPVAKVGIGVVVLMLVVAGIFFYGILFPPPSKPVVKAPAVTKPVVKDAAAAAAKAAVDAAKLADAAAAKRVAEQEKVDADARDTPTPTPAPAPGTESVMGQSSISSDVKVNNTELNAAPAASPAFRTFVAGASIGGVFQGTPARALVNGAVVREGQVVESSLGISFDRIDSDHKVIYFKDATGAEVSKNY